MFVIEPRIMISLNLKHNMKKEKAIKLSVIISIATLICSFLTSFFFTRFLLSRPQIGDTNYGLKTTADSLTSFVSVFTFGLGTTFVRFSNKYKNSDEVESSFNIITAILSLIAVVFGVVLLILAFNNKILDVEGGKYSQKQLDDFILILITSVCYTALSIFLGNSKWLLEKQKNCFHSSCYIVCYNRVSSCFNSVCFGRGKHGYCNVNLFCYLFTWFFHICSTET